ncbi:hypothetical protein ACIBG8_27995 [Nonomuraea sp. NPDC050556]|uniref:hypothetical protein n=1 Tax=Nonomuraea sp. NPDC050556 TaxID=3364369 RepID=UPI003795EC8B
MGSLLFAAAPASAAPAAAAKTTKADDPYSVFDVQVKAPKTVKRGGKITYRISAVNTGPYQADNYYMGGPLPKGIVSKLRWNGPDGTQCDWDSSGFWCWGPWILEKGDSDWLTITVTLKKGTKGTAKTRLGAIVYDVPTGMEDLNKEELDRVGGFNTWFYAKSVKTKILN